MSKLFNSEAQQHCRENAFGFHQLKHNLQVTQGMDVICTVQNTKVTLTSTDNHTVT